MLNINLHKPLKFDMLRTGFLLIIFVYFTSCNSKIYFTPDVKSQLAKYNHPLEQVQFYIDRRITLTNEKLLLDSLGNKLFTRKVIKFRQNTPGIYLSSKDTLIAIKFEKDSTNQLTFGTNSKPIPTDHYRITALKWLSEFGYINYDKTTYLLLMDDSYASLKIRSRILKRLEKRDTHKRVVKGIKLADL
jgi:hypothetical protein